MKKVKRPEEAVSHIDPDEILPEYDFSRARPNKYAPRYRKFEISLRDRERVERLLRHDLRRADF